MSSPSTIYFSIQIDKMLPEIRQRNRDGQHQVYDPVRKKYVVWQPEEMVRQLLIQYLHKVYQVPLSRMAVERGMMIQGQRKRFDLVIFDKLGKPWMLAECKAFDVSLNANTAIQTAIYNSKLECPFLLMSNGPVCLLCAVNFKTREVEFLDRFPDIT